MGMNGKIEREALDWVISLAEPDFAAWDEFDAWLATDPAHGQAYWSMAERDRRIVAVLASSPGQEAPAVAEIVPHRMRRWSSLAGWPIAASLLIAVAGYAVLRRPADDRMVVTTEPGVTRTVDLPDRSRIALNGGTSLVIERGNRNLVRLIHGQASFSVRHDPGRPFTVSVGDAAVVDVGTRFDIVRDAAATRVAVAEGAVRYVRDGLTLTLAAGQTFSIADGSEAARIGRIDPAFVSGWRAHILVYDRAPLSMVVADLERCTGLNIHLSPEVTSGAYTGTLSTDGTKRDVILRLAAIMNVQATRRGDEWLLSRR